MKSLCLDSADTLKIKVKVNTRFKKWLDALEKIVGIPKTEPRTFSWELKKQLYDQNPVCNICGNKIMIIDDAVIDHIEHYWRGGKTIPSNARLAHRYCNQKGVEDTMNEPV